MILYHYTSGTGLLGIFNSSSLWATKIQYMNDSSEFIHAIQLAKTKLRELENSNNDIKIKKVAAKLSEYLERSSDLALYVICFSEVEDSLSQWRGYCPPSFGYSIGFNSSRLATLARSQGFRFSNCIYDRHEKEKVIDDWVQLSVSELSEGLELNEEKDLEEYFRTHSNGQTKKFIDFAAFLKHETFKDEKEWRLVALIPSNDKRLNLREGKSMLIPYAPLDLYLDSEDSLIYNINVGPTPKLELAQNAISHLFEKAHIMNGIGRTMIPYRDW